MVNSSGGISITHGQTVKCTATASSGYTLNSGQSPKEYTVSGNITYSPTASADNIGEEYHVQFILYIGMNGEHKTVQFSANNDTSNGTLELIAGSNTDFNTENGSCTFRLYPREGYKINKIEGGLRIDRPYHSDHMADLDVNGTQIQLGQYESTQTISEPIHLVYSGDGVGWDYYDFSCTWNA